MQEYILRHTKCGAVWDASYNVSPEMMVCIKCGENVKTRYVPVISVVTPNKEDRYDKGIGKTKLQ